MLHIPEQGSNTSCIVGIDPGSENLGIAVLEFDLTILCITKTTAKTIVGSKLMKKNSWAIELHGERASRIEALQEAILDVLNQNNPIIVVCESPFFSSRMPSAFGVLVEVMLAIKQAVSKFSVWKLVHFIDPPTVKRGVGGKGNADKFKMKELVCNLSDLCYHGNIAIADLDEHSIDAIAVAYTRFKELTSN